MFIIDSLAPLFLLIVLGAFLAHRRLVSTRLFNESNKLVYYLALPALLFIKVAEARIEGDAASRVIGVLLAGMVASIVVSVAVAWALHTPRRQVGAMVQGSYRGNIAYIGLPLVLFATTGSSGAVDAQIEALAAVVIAALVPIYSIGSVVVLLLSAAGTDQQARVSAKNLLKQIVTNPLVLACLAGIAWSLTGWSVPLVLSRTLDTLGQMSLPLALLGIGGSLTFTALHDRLAGAFSAASIKLLVGPAAGLAMGLWLGLSTGELQLALIYLGTPTSVASYVMAQQLGSDEALAGSIVVVSTLLSLLTLAGVLLFAQSGLLMRLAG